MPTHSPHYTPPPDPWAKARCNAKGGSCVHFRIQHGPTQVFLFSRNGCWYGPEGCECGEDWPDDTAK